MSSKNLQKKSIHNIICEQANQFFKKIIIILLVQFILMSCQQQVEEQNTFPVAGNVGINTMNPEYPLDVIGSVRFSNSNVMITGKQYSIPGNNIGTFTGNLHFDAPIDESSVKAITFGGQGTTNTAAAGIYVQSGSSYGSNMFFGTTNSYSTGSIIRMSINSLGKVFIGSSNFVLPEGYRLYVEEGILTEKLKIALNSSKEWADFVFEPGYKLMPLAELTDYIKANKHLPGISSGREMIKNGLDVAEMQKLHMQKIEELTLYIIEQEKRIKSLEEKLSKEK